MDNLFGGTEMQYFLLKKYVDISDINIKLVPSLISPDYNTKNPNVLWTHQSYDMLESLEVIPQYPNLDRVVFVSNWQQRNYVEKLRCPEEKTVVIENGIEPIVEHTKPTNKINLVYMSTPYRGLDILLEAFKRIQNENVHLHVFSSMAIYGQNEKDYEYEHLYEICRNHPKITYHGSVNHSDMIAALQEMHILAYPSTFEETSCISVIEAMSAQCSVVCSNLGALPETTNHFANMYSYQSNKIAHANLFTKHLTESIERYKQENHKLQKEFFDYKYSWDDTIKYKWKTLLESIKQNNVLNLNYV